MLKAILWSETDLILSDSDNVLNAELLKCYVDKLC